MALVRSTLAVIACALVPVHDVASQVPQAHPADVGSIAAIVRAAYEVISGPAGAARQWRRDSTLYAPSATFTALSERDGRPVVITVTACAACTSCVGQRTDPWSSAA